MQGKKYFTTVLSFVKLTPRPRPTLPRPRAMRPVEESRTIWLTSNGRQTILEVY